VSGFPDQSIGGGSGVVVRFARLAVAVLALAAIGTGLWRLQAATTGLEIEQTRVGSVPVTVHRPVSDESAPVVLVAHGFAGSRQLMQPFAVTLARNGYIALTFDFPGHGGNPQPFVARIEDQSRRVQLLVGALDSVAGYTAGLRGSDGRMALLGHSMAGDALVRYAAAHRDEVAATVLVSPYLAADAPTALPRNMLILYGALEPDMLHETGRKAVADAIGGAVETGVLYGSFADGTARRLALINGAEHIGILYGRGGIAAALDWLDRALGRTGSGFVDDRGSALGLLFLGILALAWPLSGMLPRAATGPLGAGLGWRRLLPVAVVPAVLTPLLLRFAPTDYLPVLLGDYLALHFGVYGAITAVGLYLIRRRSAAGDSGGHTLWWPLLVTTLSASAYVTLAIALPMDRYVTAFLPDGDRFWIMLAMVPGIVAFFAADGWLTRGTGAPRSAPVVTKLLFLLSLLLAIALNLRDLFFLIIIVPAILLFFLVYGLMGDWVYRRTWHPLAGALASGLAFAWAMAVTFPLVA